MNRSHGFTLIELMITLSIAAIVLALGVPSFQEMMRNNRAATHMNEFTSALNLARSEAIKRGQRVALCPSINQTSCTGASDWEDGWIVFVDTALTDTDPPVVGQVLRVFENLSGAPEFTGPDNIRYLPSGAIAAAAVVPVAYTLGTIEQAVCISLVGRPYIKKDHPTCP